MKKTIIAMLAASGLASAATYTPLESSDSWTLASGRYTPVQYDNGTLYSSGWNQGYAHYDFSTPITLSEGESLKWSFDLTSNHTNTVATLTFETASVNVVMGSGAYDTNIGYGVTNDDSTTGYVVSGGWGVQLGASFKNFSNVTFTAGTPYTMSGLISKGGDNYTMTIDVNGVNYATVDLGAEFALNGIVFSADGANDVGQGSRLSNLTLTTVPEPATATLSLLALAGLAARRRRH
ncbi:MAG: PEP-CTERM sorting domain-containing protein [Akkermansia sp.]